jgi:hypothetical protein
MVKVSHKRHRKNKKGSRKMRGGVDDESVNNSLHLSDLNNSNGNMSQENDDLNMSGISHVDDDEHELDLNNSISLNDSMETTRDSMSGIAPNNNTNNNMMNFSLGDDDSFESQGSLHLSDFDVENADSNVSGNTTREGDSIGSLGGKKRGRKGRKTLKKRKTVKKRNGKKTRKSRKLRGGTKYGTGVGSNCNEPNQSINNTNMLELFPYRPK